MTSSKPKIYRVGKTVVMPVEVYDDLVARLLLAETDVNKRRRHDARSWLRP